YDEPWQGDEGLGEDESGFEISLRLPDPWGEIPVGQREQTKARLEVLSILVEEECAKEGFVYPNNAGLDDSIAG
ncbi:MAG: hypothetical protein WAX89_06185, partial [Alphaproteobacteria bacterium]